MEAECLWLLSLWSWCELSLGGQARWGVVASIAASRRALARSTWRQCVAWARSTSPEASASTISRCSRFDTARPPPCTRLLARNRRSEEHTSELQSLMRISYAVFCLQKKKNKILL